MMDPENGPAVNRVQELLIKNEVKTYLAFINTTLSFSFFNHCAILKLDNQGLPFSESIKIM